MKKELKEIKIDLERRIIYYHGKISGMVFPKSKWNTELEKWKRYEREQKCKLKYI